MKKKTVALLCALAFVAGWYANNVVGERADAALIRLRTGEWPTYSDGVTPQGAFEPAPEPAPERRVR